MPELTAWEITKAYLVMTPTHYFIGRLVAIFPYELILSEAAWIPNVGRFSRAFAEGILDEVEPIDVPVIIPKSAIIVAIPWDHPIPRTVK